jgi:hypothetical protein
MIIEKICGVVSIVLLLFLVRSDANRFSLTGKKEAAFFAVAMLAVLGYFIGWVFYWNGNHSPALILGALVALPPIHYAFLGPWRGNTPLTVMGAVFLAAHLSNVWNNLR